MGNSHSTSLGQCLTSAVGGNSGLVALPSSVLYQFTDVKPYNLDIKVTPAAVTYPQTAEQVASILKCAKDASVKVQARSGGHSYGNYGIGGIDGTIVIDMKNFQQYSMDNQTWVATVGAGTLLADVTDRMLASGNRAIAHGTCPQVGIGGHATIGGLGPASRMWGSALDHVVEATVVLADGTIAVASELQNEDVFFALKGAAASFGIITEFKFLTHEAPKQAVQYKYSFTGQSAAVKAEAFKKWQDLISEPGLSRKFATQVIIMELGMLITGTYFGSKTEFDALNITAKFPSATSANFVVLSDWLGMVAHWAEDEALKIAGGISSAFYSKSMPFRADTLIPSAGIDNFFNFIDTANKGTLIWFAIFDLEGGATNDVPMNATAYGHRDALFYLQTYAVNIGSVSTTTRAFINGINGVIQKSMPTVAFGAYAGYVDPALPNAQTAYWGSNLPKLRQIKTRIDPTDMFHNPQSVPCN